MPTARAWARVGQSGSGPCFLGVCRNARVTSWQTIGLGRGGRARGRGILPPTGLVQAGAHHVWSNSDAQERLAFGGRELEDGAGSPALRRGGGVRTGEAFTRQLGRPAPNGFCHLFKAPGSAQRCTKVSASRTTKPTNPYHSVRGVQPAARPLAHNGHKHTHIYKVY